MYIEKVTRDLYRSEKRVYGQQHIAIYPLFSDYQDITKKNFFSYFSTKTYVVGTQKNRLNETVLLSTQNILYVQTDGFENI